MTIRSVFVICSLSCWLIGCGKVEVKHDAEHEAKKLEHKAEEAEHDAEHKADKIEHKIKEE